MVELPKAYQPQSVEEKWQSLWTTQGCFHADEHSEKPAYSIVIPPPNVTGVLHLGHVLNNTLQDILCRRARQKGKEVLWLPGTDHAGIATQVRVEKQLRQEEGKTRHDVGREAFLEKVWEWKQKHGDIIINQLKKLGCSCDWERERFTMDEAYSSEISQVFIDLFKDGLIYRGRRMVNWCPVSLTALSDEEVIMKPQRSQMFTVRYRLADNPHEFLTVATTRPETIVSDVAIAVHPTDERFAHLIGKKVLRPLNETPIPIIADEYVDKEFGEGALKVTPAHDKADFEIGLRHGLEVIDMLTPDGFVDCPAVPELHGLERFAARKVAAQLLEAKGLLVKTEEYDNNVGFSERADVPIEPRLSMQWFLKYPCVEEATKAVAEGDIVFRPARWRKTYAHWMGNIQDWCISRQLWWGHRIPVWYKKEKALELKEAGALNVQALEAGDIYVGTAPPCDPENWVQDDDVLDTWFSSWLWPFSTMDEATRAKFYPTTDLVTGPDIIFFWVARMIMAGYKFQGQKPFSNVYYTSIIRDLQGRKMSKSLGNSPDPLDLMAVYGADGLRFGLMRIAPAGSDLRFDEHQIEEGRNFANKLYNAVRFRLMQGAAPALESLELEDIHVDILSKLEQLEAHLEEAYAAYEFGGIAQLLYQFFWTEYCDWFLEAVKGDLREEAPAEKKATTLRVMDTILEHYLALLHPYMPHITEELWESLGYAQQYQGRPLMQTLLPESVSLLAGVSEQEREESALRIKALYETATKGRNLKAEYKLGTNKNVKFVLKNTDALSERELARLALLCSAKSVELSPDYEPLKGTPAALTPLGELFLPLEGLVDIAGEKERLSKEMEQVAKEVTKCEQKLGNASFVDRAPEVVVAQERQRLEEWKSQWEQLKAMFEALG